MMKTIAALLIGALGLAIWLVLALSLRYKDVPVQVHEHAVTAELIGPPVMEEYTVSLLNLNPEPVTLKLLPVGAVRQRTVEIKLYQGTVSFHFSSTHFNIWILHPDGRFDCDICDLRAMTFNSPDRLLAIDGTKIIPVQRLTAMPRSQYIHWTDEDWYAYDQEPEKITEMPKRVGR